MNGKSNELKPTHLLFLHIPQHRKVIQSLNMSPEVRLYGLIFTPHTSSVDDISKEPWGFVLFGSVQQELEEPSRRRQ